MRRATVPNRAGGRLRKRTVEKINRFEKKYSDSLIFFVLCLYGIIYISIEKMETVTEDSECMRIRKM